MIKWIYDEEYLDVICFLRWWFSSFIHRPFCNGIWLRWHSPHRPIFARILCRQYRIGRGTCIESIDFHRPNRPKFHCHQNEKLEWILDLDRGEQKKRAKWAINRKAVKKQMNDGTGEKKGRQSELKVYLLFSVSVCNSNGIQLCS